MLADVGTLKEVYHGDALRTCNGFTRTDIYYSHHLGRYTSKQASRERQFRECKYQDCPREDTPRPPEIDNYTKYKQKIDNKKTNHWTSCPAIVGLHILSVLLLFWGLFVVSVHQFGHVATTSFVLGVSVGMLWTCHALLIS